jgi:hypothetical protein
MSWDFYMTIDTGGSEPAEVGDDVNMTYNVAPMYCEAFNWHGKKKRQGIRGIEGMKGKRAVKVLQHALARMKADPPKYEAMNPSNGWGDYESAMKCLEDLIAMAKAHPKATFGIC